MCVRVSRSTAVDLLGSSRGARDARRQHIQHQLDSLRFYDSVPLYDGLRRCTPSIAATAGSASQTTHLDSPWPALPPKQPRHASAAGGRKRRLRRVVSEPTTPCRGGRGLWSLAGAGRPSAAPRWPTTAETAGGLRPRHWPPAAAAAGSNERAAGGGGGGPYWIRLESALTMTKPEDDHHDGSHAAAAATTSTTTTTAAAAGGDHHHKDAGTFEYRVDVPASEQRRTSTAADKLHQQQQQQQHEMYPSAGQQLYPDADVHQYVNTGYQFSTDDDQTAYLNGGGSDGQRYQTGMTSTATYPASVIIRDDDECDVLGRGDVTGTCDDRRHHHSSHDRRHRRRRHQRHNDSSTPAAADVTMTSPPVDPPRYELFTHV